MASVNNICKVLCYREISNQSFSCSKLSCERLSLSSKEFYKKNLIAHYGCVNAIEFNNDGQLLTSGGDDRRVLLWHTQKALHNVGKPVVMKSEHMSNIFCLSFDNNSTHVYSAGNDEQVLLHNLETKKCIDIFNHEQAVYTVSVDPFNDYVFATASEDGKVLVFDRRADSTDPLVAAESISAFHCAMFNPVDSKLIATANSREGVAVYDTRVNNKELQRFGRKENCMNVRWDQTGKRMLTLRRRQPAALYVMPRHDCVAEFNHPSYHNSCTMKSCCFAGFKDEYVLSGSDDFNLYMWKIPDRINYEKEDTPLSIYDCTILKGHRSIVNQVRFHPESCIIASSGVEKLIKLWSPMPMPCAMKDTVEQTRQRYTHDDYIDFLLRSEFIDYSTQSVEEDPHMMAFFDSLVQRERRSNSDEDSQSYFSGSESLIDNELSSLTDDDSDDEIVDIEESESEETELANEENSHNVVNNKSVRTNARIMPRHLIDYSDTDDDDDINSTNDGGNGNSYCSSSSPLSPSPCTSSSSFLYSPYESTHSSPASGNGASNSNSNSNCSSTSSSSSSNHSHDSGSDSSVTSGSDCDEYVVAIFCPPTGGNKRFKRKRRSKKDGKRDGGRRNKRNRRQINSVDSTMYINNNHNNNNNNNNNNNSNDNDNNDINGNSNSFTVYANKDRDNCFRFKMNKLASLAAAADSKAAIIDDNRVSIVTAATEDSVINDATTANVTSFPTFKRDRKRSYRIHRTVRDSSSESD